MARPFWGEANVIMDSQMPDLAASGEFSQPAVYAQPFPFTFPVLRRDIDMNQAAPFDEPVSIPRGQPIYTPPFDEPVSIPRGQPIYTPPVEEPPVVSPTRDDSPITSQPRKKQKEKEPRRRKQRKTTSTVPKTSSRNAPSPDESSGSPGRVDGTMDGDENDSDGDDGGAGDGGRGRKWRSWEIVVLLEAKRDEAVQRASSAPRGIILRAKERWELISRKCKAKGVNFDGAQCRGKWNVIIRDYRKIIDHNARSGKEPWESMSSEDRKATNLPLVFEDEHLTILDSFMKDKPGQNPASIADSFVLLESNVYDSDEATWREAQLKGKRKRPVGENKKFLVDGMRDNMREYGEVMTKLESDRLGDEKELEHTRLTEQRSNCDKICDVLRMLVGAMATM